MAFEVERIIDANINRLTEGLRVIEDQTRFGNSQKNIIEEFKAIRHSVTNIVKELNLNLLENRFLDNDHGRDIKGESEYERLGVQDLLMANFKRAQEACRVIEESLKIFSNKESQTFEKHRYRLYDLQQIVVLNKPFPINCLYALITKSLCKKEPLEIVKMIRDGGADILQLREKDMEDAEFLEWALQVKEVLSGSEVSLIINDRIHIAQLIDAQGVHLGQGDLDISQARKLLKPWQWIGRSTSALPVAKKAFDEGHTYIGVGPLFPTNTKKHRGAVGLEYIEQVNENCSIPYVAIGAINRDTIDSVLEAKPKGIAVCTGIIAGENPLEETLFFKNKINSVDYS
jgi:thiamine-phosphate pyrophosphorylase